jgi:hypothetical protein|nr:MAG TPA: hypothetical protein [Caudoviricetes sp.]
MLEKIMKAWIVDVYGYCYHTRYFQNDDGNYTADRCRFRRKELEREVFRLIDKCGAEVEIKENGKHIIIVDESSFNI